MEKEDVIRMNKLLTKNGFICETKTDCYPQKELLLFLRNKDFDDLIYIHFSGHGNNVGRKIQNRVEMLSSWVNPNNTECYSNDIDKILFTQDNSLNCERLNF